MTRICSSISKLSAKEWQKVFFSDKKNSVKIQMAFRNTDTKIFFEKRIIQHSIMEEDQ